MGIFSFLRKEAEKERQLKEITLEELEPYLQNFIKKSGVETKISVLERDIKSKITRLNELLESLEHSKLKEEKVIPERLKSIFEGNKRAFIDKIKAFIQELKVPSNPEDVDAFLEQTSEKLNALSEDTQKNYFVLREFIEDHVQPVAAKIKDIDSMLSTARAEFDRTPLGKIREVRAHQKKYYLLLQEVEKLEEELKHTLLLKETELERKNKFDSKLDQIKETKAYEEYIDLQERRKKLSDSLWKIEQDVRDLFSKLEHALKKHNREREDTLVEKYLSKPVDALFEDAELLILNELSHIKSNIKLLSLKKEKEDSVLEALEILTDEKLRELREKLVEIKNEQNIVNDRYKNNLYERNINEREGWIEHVNKNIEAIEKKQSDIEDLIERMNPKLVKQKIRDMLRVMDDEVELK
jgi:hypothetical protein